MEDDGLPLIPVRMATWTRQEEELLASWAERAAGYRWLHDKTSKYYDSMNRFLEIPVSILSYLSGGAILSGNLGENVGRYIVGTISIFGGILTNVQSALRWKELGEKHRLIGNLFSAYHRNITAELSLEPQFRMNPLEYLRMKRTEFDRYIEQSPVIPQIIIAEFNEKFKDVKMSKPEITNGIHPVVVYRKSPKVGPTSKDSMSISVKDDKDTSPFPFKAQLPPIRTQPTNEAEIHAASDHWRRSSISARATQLGSTPDRTSSGSY